MQDTRILAFCILSSKEMITSGSVIQLIQQVSIVLFSVLLMGMVASANSQFDEAAQWEIVQRSHYPFTLQFNGYFYDIFFTDPKTGWAVGDGGFVVKTENGGETWNQQQTGVTEDLLTVYFVNATVGWVAGRKWTLLHTSDGGRSWERRLAPMEYIQDLYFANPFQGWIVGFTNERDGFKHRIFHTADGGKTWMLQFEIVGGELPVLHFINEREGWVGVYERNSQTNFLLHTTDGGATWEQLNFPEVEGTIAGLWFLDSNTGWMGIGYFHRLFQTQDGGKTWMEQKSTIDAPLSASPGLTQLQFINAHHGWWIGTDGVISHTADGGQNWRQQQSNISFHLRSLFFVDEKTGWVVGNNGAILHTQDGGTTWQSQAGFLHNLKRAAFINAQEGWILTDAFIGHTTDGGRHWENLAAIFANEMEFIDSEQGWLMSTFNGAIFHSRDGGKSWQTQATGYQFLRGMEMIDAQRGWVVGGNFHNGPIALQTQNGGESWVQHEIADQLPVNVELRIVRFLNPQQGWLIGTFLQETKFLQHIGNGVLIFRTDDGGQTWTRLEIKELTNLSSPKAAHFINPEEGWILLEDSNILHTNNGGQTWQLLLRPTSWPLNDVYFVNSNVGWIIGDALGAESVAHGGPNIMYLTVDGGQRWVPFHVTDNSNFYEITFDGESNLWVVGDYGTLLRRSLLSLPTVVKQEGTRVTTLGAIKRNALGQNYPNPLNSETWIPFSLAQPADVSLQIYDARGSLIRSLELGRLPAGAYLSKDRAIYWDGRSESGEHLASGIYFYQLHAGDNRTMKKMVVGK